MFKRILVPTDGSEQSRHALQKAIELAKKFNSELEVFHVTPTPQAYYGYNVGYNITIDPEIIEKNGELVLEATLKGLDVSGVHLIQKHISGSPASGILDEIRREFDLVIMGTVGHGGITGTLIGSVTQRVLAHTDCPVLIVK